MGAPKLDNMNHNAATAHAARPAAHDPKKLRQDLGVAAFTSHKIYISPKYLKTPQAKELDATQKRNIVMVAVLIIAAIAVAFQYL